jgi:uncharacterized protein YndB with AHSA1/START domain
MTIHQEIDIAATPERVYDALVTSKQFSEFTGGAPADIEAKPGGAITMFGGHITGRNIETMPGKRLVQAWRAKDWVDGHYSLVRFELRPQGKGTRLVFDHTGYPEDQHQHLEPGWHKMYWEPLKKYLA